MLQNINAYFSIKSVPQGKASFTTGWKIVTAQFSINENLMRNGNSLDAATSKNVC
jgi:hypothetical protein